MWVSYCFRIVYQFCCRKLFYQPMDNQLALLWLELDQLCNGSIHAILGRSDLRHNPSQPFRCKSPICFDLKIHKKSSNKSNLPFQLLYIVFVFFTNKVSLVLVVSISVSISTNELSILGVINSVKALQSLPHTTILFDNSGSVLEFARQTHFFFTLKKWSIQFWNIYKWHFDQLFGLIP
jgi:hypothetical protein